MKNSSTNQYTGRNSPGFRFCFHIRAIAHRSIFLPLVMKNLPQTQRLLKGESPLSVFKCDSYREARLKFSELRKKFDFAYWAITEYYIHDINDADNMITLRMNSYQRYLIDIMQKRYHNRQFGRYVVTKTFPRCGLTTCIQAYITWLQTYQCCNNSYTCSSSEINLHPLKADLCRFLKRDVVPSEKWIYLPERNDRALFNTYRSPDFCRGINLGYVHLADMSKWKDPEGLLSSRTYAAASSAVLLDYFTLVMLEGNIPKEVRFPFRTLKISHLPFDIRLWNLKHLSNNPFFLAHVVNASHPIEHSCILHIHLDDLFNPGRRIQIRRCN